MATLKSTSTTFKAKGKFQTGIYTGQNFTKSIDVDPNWATDTTKPAALVDKIEYIYGAYSLIDKGYDIVTTKKFAV